MSTASGERTAPGRRAVSPWLQRRTLLDRLVCLVAALPLAPIAALLAGLVRATSPGAPVIRLPRIGLHGRPFGLWKLRSMRVADPVAATGSAAPAFTVAGDDRITPVGHLLRRLRLDEIPQLLNVLAGEMALIGPRPKAPAYVDLADPRWHDVLQARPGIAGPTQLLVHEWEASISDPDAYVADVVPVKLAIDAWYVEHATPAIDLLVVVGLARSLLLRHGDTALHRKVRSEVPEAARIPTDP